MKLLVNIVAVAALILSSAVLPAQDSAPAAPAPTLSSLDPFPPVNPKNFTADLPSPSTVNAFLKQLWGYDENRIWSVAAIQKTQAPNVSRVVVYVSERGSTDKPQGMAFFTTPDGRHAISGGDIINFGPTPFAETRKTLLAHADGPARGAAGKDLLLVEFADMQCPHCKEQQSTIENLLKDFPNARIVFQNYPLTDIHPSAYKAAAYGVCVAQKNNDAFFQYVQAVFDTQDGLTVDSTEKTLADAVTKAGQDPATIAACADSAATKAIVDAQLKLATDLNVLETPTLAINGRLIPLGQVSYDILKQIIRYQATQDGVSTGEVQTPALSNVQ
jgi:protein-disulfide isomerase